MLVIFLIFLAQGSGLVLKGHVSIDHPPTSLYEEAKILSHASKALVLRHLPRKQNFDASSILVRCLLTSGCFPGAQCDDSRNTSKNMASDIGSAWHTCKSRLPRDNCLVYSFGIADDPGYDLAMGKLGCEVHSFDPTINYKEIPTDEDISQTDKSLHRLGHNVSFHKWGLRGDKVNESMTTNYVGSEAAGYRGIEGEMLDLSTIMDRLGHTGRKLDVLKVDCEGCEWEVLDSLSRSNLNLPDQIIAELHFQKFAVKGKRGAAMISNAVKFLWESGYRPVHEHVSGVAYQDAEIDEVINQLTMLPRIDDELAVTREEFHKANPKSENTTPLNNIVLEVSFARLASDKEPICVTTVDDVRQGRVPQFEDIQCM